MVEENQNVEMEDILSSIKNILEEDEQGRDNLADETPAEDIVDLSPSTDIDDILDLSPEMRIEETKTDDAVVSDASSKDVVDELISGSVTDTGTDPLSELTTTETAEPLSMAETESIGVSIGTEDVDADSMFDIDFASPMPSLSEETAEYEDDAITAELDKITLSEPEETPVAEPAIQFETKVDDPVVEATPDVTDVSANIISNFAKMFSQTESEPKVETTPTVDIQYSGNTSKTLEEFVLDSITKVIGQEIKSKWNNGADYHAYATAEINRQISQWINDNLPTLVEKIVKEEIERVIAKVNS